jgi:hypothetical protein
MNTYGKSPSQYFMGKTPKHKMAKNKIEGKSGGKGKGKPNIQPSNPGTFRTSNSDRLQHINPLF